MTDGQADNLLVQMLDDIAADDDSDVATAWLRFWDHMPNDDKLLLARRGAPRVLDLAFERGIKPGHPEFPRVGVLYAAFSLAIRLSD